MGVDRRKFVKIAGAAALGLTAAPPIKLFSSETEEKADTSLCNTATDSCVCKPPEVDPVEQGLKKDPTRWAMVVNLGECRKHEDCKDCILACHETHNVPDFPKKKDEVKWIWKEQFSHAFHEVENEFGDEELNHSPALLLCNHCDNPPCVKVCPTQATWKREQDGIVMMDWHRCIGCRYCLAACPYGSRSFNYRDPRPHIKEINTDFPTRMRGVVEKCTFCDERLAEGKLPACVDACKYGCLTFGDLEDADSKVRELLHSHFTIRRKPGLGTQPEVFYIV
ncbi:MAG: 4Fe-4S dicluster domain-containing protein [Candidatus Electryonea clarkiae]|nr:4Fe-4S dicluster domain-containing protein [Candidatus Electryonea clarkiae]MDP8288360.1 4Fe-4S dicluster domain-containing protein [Candidatus Electryonea clarkiae]